MQHGTAHPATRYPLGASQKHPKRTFPCVATWQFSRSHNSITIVRRLPYALHRANGTVPAVPICGSRPRMPHNGPKSFHEGRLETFPSPQAVASVTPPWDPGRKSLGDGRRRLQGYRQPQIAKIATGENIGKLRVSEASILWEPKKSSLFRIAQRGNPQPAYCATN
jgi:hypothetical protein